MGDLRVAPARRPARPLRGRAGPSRARTGCGRSSARHRVTHLGLSPDGRPGADPARHGAGPRPRPPARSASWARPASRGIPRAWWWYFREVGGGRLPVVNYSGGTEVSGGIVGCNLLTPIKPASFNGPCLGTAADVVDADGRSLRGEVGELVIRRAAAGHDPRLLARPGSLRRDVLEPAARDVGPRRLGDRRRRRLLVHPRPLGRHAQGRGQARRPGRGRGRGDRPSERRRGGRDRRARTRSRARRSSSSARSAAGETDDDGAPRPRSAGASSRTSARRSSRRRSSSSPPCRRRARARSCGASSGRPGSASTRATCRRSTTRRRSRRSAARGRPASRLRRRRRRMVDDERRDRQGHRHLGRPRRHGRGPRERRSAPTTT